MLLSVGRKGRNVVEKSISGSVERTQSDMKLFGGESV